MLCRKISPGAVCCKEKGLQCCRTHPVPKVPFCRVPARARRCLGLYDLDIVHRTKIMFDMGQTIPMLLSACRSASLGEGDLATHVLDRVAVDPICQTASQARDRDRPII